MANISTVILAAGNSTRYKGKSHKLLEQLGGLPVISHVYRSAKKISGNNVIIVCNKKNINKFKKIIDCKFIIQNKQRGTADAILCAKPFLKNKNFLVLFGDVPLISLNTLRSLISNFENNKRYGSMVAFNSKNPTGYGRLIVKKNKVIKVIEEIDATKNEKEITLCNSGVMIVNSNKFFKYLSKIKLHKRKKEKYLPDIFEIYSNYSYLFSYITRSEEEMLGINTLADFTKADKVFQNQIIQKFINNGVLIENPESCRFSYDTLIQKGAKIESNVVCRNDVKIFKGTIIKSHSYLEGVLIKENSIIGPNARIRPNSFVSKNVKIGNYVEIKNSYIGDFSSIAHLSYIGDSKVGKRVNIGAGTITCNFDGKKKNNTIIMDGVFIGSNSSLIAPLTINKNAKIGAGSVINKDIPEKNLAIERSKLKIIEKN